MNSWLANHSAAISIWCGAICTLAIYSVLYAENRFYRFFEHVFIGLGTGYGVYITWAEVLGPKWWTPMVKMGHWYWAFAAVAGSMFYFMYSSKHVWISRVIFGFFMGYAAGGIFREFYSIYFPQIGSSMKPLTAANGSFGWVTVGAAVFYVILFSAMSYFFFSFEQKNPMVSRTAKAGRWFLMIGFGAIFGATVMGRLTLLIGRLNFLISQWIPQVGSDMGSRTFQIGIGALVVAVIAYLVFSMLRPKKPKTST